MSYALEDRRSATDQKAEPGSPRPPADNRRFSSGEDWRRASWSCSPRGGPDRAPRERTETFERTLWRARPPLFLGRMRRGRPAGGVTGRPFLFDGRANRHDVGAGCMELHRFARDIDADGAAEAVGVPLEHVAPRVAARDEAGLVGRVALAAAPA